MISCHSTLRSYQSMQMTGEPPITMKVQEIMAQNMA